MIKSFNGNAQIVKTGVNCAQFGVIRKVVIPQTRHQRIINSRALRTIGGIHRLEEKGMSVDQLIESSGLEKKRVQAIVSGNYTASPSERQRLAAAVGVSRDEIAWGHSVQVKHLRGNGPQSGRST